MSTISSGTTLTTALVQTGDTTGDLVIKTNNGNTTAVTFNAAGAIGVGSSPSYGSVGQYLQSAGNAAPATWATVTQTRISGGTTGLTPSTLTSGDVTLAGTLTVANGGTGSTTLTANNVLLGNGTSALQTVAPGTSGNVLTSNGTTWASSALTVNGTAKAWVSFNGTNGSIRGSFNVSSVSRNGTGEYTVNFTSALSTANYAKTCTPSGINGQGDLTAINTDRMNSNFTAPTTTAFKIWTKVIGSSQDPEYVSAAAFA